jgi:hypothetical protein
MEKSTWTPRRLAIAVLLPLFLLSLPWYVLAWALYVDWRSSSCIAPFQWLR